MAKKKYNPETNSWEDIAAEHSNLAAARDALLTAKVPFYETASGIYVEDTDVAAAQSAISAVIEP